MLGSQNRFLAFPRDPGGFREVREACRNHFHLPWYLSDTVVASCSQRPSWWELSTVDGRNSTGMKSLRYGLAFKIP